MKRKIAYTMALIFFVCIGTELMSYFLIRNSFGSGLYVFEGVRDTERTVFSLKKISIPDGARLALTLGSIRAVIARILISK